MTTMLLAATQRIYRYVLKRLIGEYLDSDLHLDQLDVRLREGSVELRDVGLNAEAVNAAVFGETRFGLRSATLESIRMKIPGGIPGDSCAVEISGIRLRLSTRSSNEHHVDVSSSSSPPGPSSPLPASSTTSLKDSAAAEQHSDAREGVAFLAGWIEGLMSRVRVELCDVCVDVECGGSTDGEEEEQKCLLRVIVERASYYAPSGTVSHHEREVRLGGKVGVWFVHGSLSAPLFVACPTSDAIARVSLDPLTGRPVGVEASVAWVASELEPNFVSALSHVIEFEMRSHAQFQKRRRRKRRSIGSGSDLMNASWIANEPKDVFESRFGAEDLSRLKSLAPDLFFSNDDVKLSDDKNKDDDNNAKDDEDDEVSSNTSDEFFDAMDATMVQSAASFAAPALVASRAERKKFSIQIKIQRAQLTLFANDSGGASSSNDPDATWLDSWESAESATSVSRDPRDERNALVVLTTGLVFECSTVGHRSVGSASFMRCRVVEVGAKEFSRVGWSHDVLTISSSSSTFPGSSAATAVDELDPNILVTFDSDSSVHARFASTLLDWDMGLLSRHSALILVISSPTTTSELPLRGGGRRRQRSLQGKRNNEKDEEDNEEEEADVPIDPKNNVEHFPFSLSFAKFTVELSRPPPLALTNSSMRSSPRASSCGSSPGSSSPSTLFGTFTGPQNPPPMLKSNDDVLVLELDELYVSSNRARSNKGRVYLVQPSWARKITGSSTLNEHNSNNNKGRAPAIPVFVLPNGGEVRVRLSSDVLLYRRASHESSRASSLGSGRANFFVAFDASGDNSSDEDEEAFDGAESRFQAVGQAECGISLEIAVPRVEANELWGEVYQRAVASSQLALRASGVSGTTSPSGAGTVDLPFVSLTCESGAVLFKDEKGGPDLAVSFSGVSLSCIDGMDVVARVGEFSLTEVFNTPPEKLEIPVVYSTKHWGSKETPMAVVLIQQVSDPGTTSLVHTTVSEGDNNNVGGTSPFGGGGNGGTWEQSVSICIRGATIRHEVASQWSSRAERLMTPDGRSMDVTPVWFTNMRVSAYDFVVDYSPTQSPEPYALKHTHAAAPPDHRALLYFSRLRARSNLVSGAQVQTYKYSARDVDVFVASPAPLRDPREPGVSVRNGKRLKPAWSSVVEYAEFARYVRVASFGHASMDVRERLSSTTTHPDVELSLPDAALFTCADSLAAVVELLACLSNTPAAAPLEQRANPIGKPSVNVAATTTTVGRVMPVVSPPEPKPVVAPRGKASVKRTPISSVQQQAQADPPQPTVSRIRGPPRDSELSAKDLREKYANAPDSELSAAQLRVRYQPEYHLSPFVIDDFYSIGSLPQAPPSPPRLDGEARWIAPQSGTRMGGGGGDEWSFVESLVDSPPISPKVGAADPPPSPFAPQAMIPPTKIPAVMNAKKPVPIIPSRIVGHEKIQEEAEENVSDLPQEVQLLPVEQLQDDSEDPALHAMFLRISETATRANAEAEDDVRYEAAQYTSTLAESRLSVEMAHNAMAGSVLSPREGGGLYHPGASLVLDVSGSQEEEETTAVAAIKAEVDDEESTQSNDDQSARWLDPASEVKIYTHHWGIPYAPGPGSHVPPAAALAAARLLGHVDPLPPPNAAPGFRLVVREMGLVWRVFAGRDFDFVWRRTAAVNVSPEAGGIGTTDDDPRRRHDRGPLGQLLVENHVEPLFRSSASSNGTGMTRGGNGKSRYGSSASTRDLDRAVEIRWNNVTAFVEIRASLDETMAALSIGDVHVFDHVKSSSVKKMASAWIDETRHPRETDAATVRIALESSPTERRVCVAFLPLEVCLDQDTMKMLSGVADDVETCLKSSSFLDDDDDGGDDDNDNVVPLDGLPITLDVRAFKLKVDYLPKRVDFDRLTRGEYEELINVFSYEGVEVAMKRVLVEDCTSLKSAWSVVATSWTNDITSKSLVEVLSGVSSPPINAMANLSSGLVNLVLLPMERYRTGSNLTETARVARKSAKVFAKTLLAEALGAGANISRFALSLVDSRRSSATLEPRNVREGLAVAGEALSRGVKQAHHTIVAVPLTQWERDGSSGVLRAVIRAVPVAILRPLVGATEATEMALRGMRNEVDPDAYREASKFKEFKGVA